MTNGADPDTPDLSYLMRAYFHQDYDLDGPDTVAVLDVFAREDPHRLRGARDGAAELLSRDLTEEELAAEVIASGLEEFLPEGEGLTYRQWLELVVTHLSEALESSDAQ